MGQRVRSRPVPAAPPERGTTTPTSPRGGGAPVRVSFPLAPPSPAAAARRLLIGGSAAAPRHRRWRASGRWGSGGRRHFVCGERGPGQRRPPPRGRGATGERPGSARGAGGGRAGSAERPGRASLPRERSAGVPAGPEVVGGAAPASARSPCQRWGGPGRHRGSPGRALPPRPPRGPGAARRFLRSGGLCGVFLPNPPFRRCFCGARAGLVVPTGVKRGGTAQVDIQSEIGVGKHVSCKGRELLVVVVQKNNPWGLILLFGSRGDPVDPVDKRGNKSVCGWGWGGRFGVP